jgi:hypothetical protein
MLKVKFKTQNKTKRNKNSKMNCSGLAQELAQFHSCSTLRADTHAWLNES